MHRPSKPPSTVVGRPDQPTHSDSNRRVNAAAIAGTLMQPADGTSRRSPRRSVTEWVPARALNSAVAAEFSMSKSGTPDLDGASGMTAVGVDAVMRLRQGPFDRQCECSSPVAT